MQSSKCQAIQNILKIVPAVAISNANILINGESGTGKEVLAKIIHSTSKGQKNDLVCVNCSAIPDTLLESELFGYKKGAFTGASSDHVGLFELANGGTIFLDEIGDMPLPLQAKILRVIQEKKIRPVGSNSEKAVDFKLISATHRNLKAEVARGHFREDLFYRLSVIPICLPALRERREDIPVLIENFSNYFAKKYELPVLKFTSEAIQNLVQRDWLGNVRELENVIESVVVLNVGKNKIEIGDLPDAILKNSPEKNSILDIQKFKKLPRLSELSDEYVERVLSLVNGHQGKASKILGISRRTLYRRFRSQSAIIASSPISIS